MKNEAILKRKCMEISFHTANIFHQGQEVMFTKHTFTSYNCEKVFKFCLLRPKKLYNGKYIHVTQQIEI